MTYNYIGFLTLGTDYCYYPSGNVKSYELFQNGAPYSIYTYYDVEVTSPIGIGVGTKLVAVNISSSLLTISYYYESGYLKYYYSNGYYYEYADNTTRSASTDSSVYTSRTAYTNDQALAKLNELKNY